MDAYYKVKAKLWEPETLQIDDMPAKATEAHIHSNALHQTLNKHSTVPLVPGQWTGRK